LAHAQRGWITYNLDIPSPYTLTSVSLKSDGTTAENNATTLNSTPPVAAYWPAHRSNLRYVRGFDNSAPQYKDTCVAVSSSVAMFALGAFFADGETNIYTVNGLHTETFSTRNLK
jgi:hypothetical protein